MLCEKCKKRTATVFYNENINGKTRSFSLCGECAAKLREKGDLQDITSMTGSFADPFSALHDNLFGGFFGIPSHISAQTQKKCPTCGTTYLEISKSGKVGCPQCYNTFREELTAYMQKYNTGLEVVSVVLESIHPPVEVSDIYQQLLVAKIEGERIMLDAESLAERIRINAEADKYEIIEAAKREKATAEADANLAVAEFLAFVEAKDSWTEKDEDGNVISDYTYERFRYVQAIAKAYGAGDCQIIIIGDGVNPSNIYVGNISLGGNGT